MTVKTASTNAAAPTMAATFPLNFFPAALHTSAAQAMQTAAAASAMPSVFHSHESSYSILIFSPILSSEKTGGQNANRFSPVSSSWRRSTRPSMMLMTISQVALTNALFRWPPKTSPLSFPALMCMCA